MCEINKTITIVNNISSFYTRSSYYMYIRGYYMRNEYLSKNENSIYASLNNCSLISII